MLTSNEAKELLKDPRVFDVELNPAIRDDIEIGNRASQTGDFSKTTSDTGDFVNWGLRRMIFPNPILVIQLQVTLHTHLQAKV